VTSFDDKELSLKQLAMTWTKGFLFLAITGIFLFATMSKPPLGTTLFPMVKRPEREADTITLSIAKSSLVKIYLMHFLLRMIRNKEMLYDHCFSNSLYFMLSGTTEIEWNAVAAVLC
jgi:hypothetical protein